MSEAAPLSSESVAQPHLAALPEAVQHPDAAPPSALAEFINLQQLCERLPLSERSIRAAIKKGHIPCIKLPGSRRLIFCWETTRGALLRYQRGTGAE